MKKQLIMEKALELFAEQGFDATSVQEITDRCGISKGAFYLSFSSKDELILSLVDHFMQEMVAEVDQVVRKSEKESLLYQFYYINFDMFEDRSHFAKVFVKEQAHFFNREFFANLHQYNTLMQRSIETMLDRLYGEKVSESKYELIFLIQNLIKSYLELFLFHHLPMDIDLLAKSLAEKTDLLAIEMKTPFITEELATLVQSPRIEEVTADEIVNVIEESLKEVELTEIERESLELLKQELVEPSLSVAVVVGLIRNIEKHPHLKWVAYLLKRYIKVK